MPRATDMQVIGVRLHFIPIHTRVPLKFGTETLTSVTCARAQVIVTAPNGDRADGWGETPLSVQWVWPSATSYEQRHARLKAFCVQVGKAWLAASTWGHPLETGWGFIERVLPGLLERFNVDSAAASGGPMPRLAGLLACSVFDQAVHDAYGRLHNCPTYDTYRAPFLSKDLGAFLEPEAGSEVDFHGKYPSHWLQPRAATLPAWHLVGGLDPLDASELTGTEPDDGYPVLLADWIRRDGLRLLKVKLRGSDLGWDYGRLQRVGAAAIDGGVTHLSADFNCTVTEVGYVVEVLDRLERDEPEIWKRLAYVEQPFPYDLEKLSLDVRPIAVRKPLFLDESAHDWRAIRRGRELGWNGVALKTCKTQTGAILSACWAKAHGLGLMVQDLTNPMLAQIPHVLLAAHVGTRWGVETNAMQFYPEASLPEAAVHPGLYRRRSGQIDLGTIQGPGFGYRIAEMRRELPPPVLEESRA